MSGLSVRDVVVRFGGLVAVDHVSLDAPYGRITALIGPNGAGKTTTFNVCSGYLAPAEGSVVLDGRDVTRLSATRRARLGLGRTFQRLELFRSLSVRRNVELAVESQWIGDNPLSQLGMVRGGRASRARARAEADRLLELTGLADVANQAAGELSTGQGRLLELARALARRPNLLLLDEPSSGLDARETKAFGELLSRVVAEQGIGILLVEHDMDLVLGISQWVHVLDFGKPLMEGSPDDVRRSPEVRAAYLGVHVAG